MVIAALTTIIVALVYLARSLGLEAARNVPAKALPFVNLGQWLAEQTPTKGDDESIKKIALALGYEASVNADGSIVWRKPALTIDEADRKIFG